MAHSFYLNSSHWADRSVSNFCKGDLTVRPVAWSETVQQQRVRFVVASLSAGIAGRNLSRRLF
jgi:hypothetical protein